MRWVGNIYRSLVGNSEGKRPPGRPTHRQEDTRTILKKWWEDVG